MKENAVKKDRIVRCQIHNATKKWFYMSSKGVMGKSPDKAERLTLDAAEKRVKELQDKFPNATFQVVSDPSAQDAEVEEAPAMPSRARTSTAAETKA
jgi:hypothetical protein